MKHLEIALLYNEPTLAADDPDCASETGVLESVEAVSEALVARGHRMRCMTLGSPAEALERLSNLAADVVFNLFEGFGGVGHGEAEIAGLVELLGHPLTGSSAKCLALVRDKAQTKWLLQGAGLPTPAFRLLGRHDPVCEESLAALCADGPVIVKPAHEDASLGITDESIVTDSKSLRRQVEQVRSRYGAVLVEQFIAGREFNAAIVALPEARLLPLSEIEFSGDGPRGWQIVTYDAKWATNSVADRGTPARCPAQIDQATAKRIEEIAISAFRLTGCRDYARVDLRMDDAGGIFVLEVNGNPDIGPRAGFARALKVAGIAYEQFVDQLVANAFAIGASKIVGLPAARESSSRL